MRIEWTHPEPRKGPAGWLDRFVGPGATRAELALQFSFAALAAAALPAWALHRGLGWTWWQHVLAAFIALDLAGGVVTNATSAGKRWYLGRYPALRQKLVIVALHVDPLLVAAFFRDLDWTYAGFLYGYLLAAAAVLLAVPTYLQRPLAAILYVSIVLVDLYAFAPTPGFEWFAFVFFLKVLVCHIPREEPYRP